jgi:DNA-binding beta-propeller fold protein YncE
MTVFAPVLLLGLLCLLAGAFAQTPKYKYEFTKFGAPFPNATGKTRDTASVAADGKGLILVLRRSDPPILVYNREGKLVNSWGSGLFVDDHNIDVDRFGFVWIGDRNGQIVYKFTVDGKQLMSIGTKGVKGDDTSKTSFNRASDVFVAPNGDIFVADGYENHRVVQFTKDGKFIKIIGGVAGTGPGQLSGVHGVLMDSKGRLIVLDRHDDDPRIQVWDAQTGKFIEEWAGLGLTMGSGFTMDDNDNFYVSDTNGHQLITVKDGKVVDRITGLQAEGHQATRDSGTGALYLADTGAAGGMIWKVVIKK